MYFMEERYICPAEGHKNRDSHHLHSLKNAAFSHLPVLNTTRSFIAVLAAALTLSEQGTAAQQSKCQALQVAHRTQTRVPVLLHH